MSRRDDVKRVLDGKKPEYVPWFGDLDYWLSYLKAERMIPDAYAAMGRGTLSGGLTDDGLQKLHKDLEVGFYLQAYFPFKTIYHNVEEEVLENERERIIRYKTPYGNLQEVWKYVDSTYSFAPVEFMIKDAGDLKAFRYLYENVEYVPDYELAEKRLQSVGDNGIVLAYTPKSPMMELVALKAGLETVVLELMNEEPEEFEELLECMEEKHTTATKIAIDSPAECIFVPDNLSSEMVGGNLYDTYIQKVHEDWTGLIKKAGKKSMVHLDGTLNPLLHKLSCAGFDVIEAVTPSPVGDIELEDLRKHVLENTIIWGGIPSGFFDESYSEEEFEAWVCRALKIMRKDHRFVLGVGDQVVPNTTVTRVKKVAELVKKYGKFEG